MSPHTLLFLALGGVSSAVMAAEAEDTPPAPTVFVEEAAQDGLTEVELGRVALEKSQNPTVRAFAQRMVADHQKANLELAALARQKGIVVPMQLDSEHMAVVKKLEAQSGKSFDGQYSHHMNMGHMRAISLFESATKSDDPDLAQFAKRMLPTLEEHLQLASQLPGGGGEWNH